MKFVLVFMASVLCSTNCVTCSDSNSSPNSLCSFRKSLQKCLCVYKKVPSSVFPVLYAECSRMGLKEIPNMSSVEELDVSHNAIDLLDPHKNGFASVKIRTLLLSFNRLNFIYQDYFKEVPNLIILDLSNNELVKFSNSITFRGLDKLEILNLRSNRISTLPDDIFRNLQNLKELDLSYNYLGSLFTTSENICKTSIGLNCNISTLKLDGLGIDSISSSFFNEAKNLKYLSLANNPLKMISNLPITLTYLDLSGSDITTISAINLTCQSLKILKLNRLLKLKDLEDYAFSNLKDLQELHLNDCKKLKEVNVTLFEKNRPWPIKRLHISRSGLRKLNSTFLDVLKNMDYVDFNNNPWTCDCDILWLHGLKTTLFKDANLRCASPNNVLNINVLELTEKDLPNCFDSSNYYQTIVIAILSCFIAVLAALIVYLVYLGPFYYKNKHRNIGPESPYSGDTLSSIPAIETEHEP